MFRCNRILSAISGGRAAETAAPASASVAAPYEQRALPPDKEAVLKAALENIYPPGSLQEGGLETIEVEMHTRPFWFRQRYIPWLASHTELRGARVLEIGAGTGTSTIPLAEQGAQVDSIDINPTSLEVARVRAELHGLADQVRFRAGNAADIAQIFPETYDLVVYFAAIEHMTYAERIATLRSAWSMLCLGGLLVVVDTPNRLWFFDNHTAMANFFHWLPDEVAIDYAARTPRGGFNAEIRSADAEAPLKLARWGRGVSFHDFEIALGSLDGLEISGEWEYRRQRHRGWAARWADTDAGRYHAFLRNISPQTPVPFLEEEIALSLRKPA